MRTAQIILLILIISKLSAYSQVGDKYEIVTVEQIATFPGGIKKFYEHIVNNIKYPKDISKKNKVGTVYVEFFVKEDGYIDKDSIRAIPVSELEKTLMPGFDGKMPEIIDVPESCKKEAIRVILTSPPWIPGNLRGVPRRQKMVIPVKFGK